MFSIYIEQLLKQNESDMESYSDYELSKQLGIPREITHIGMSDVTQCNRIVEISIAKLKERGIEYQVWPGDIGKV